MTRCVMSKRCRRQGILHRLFPHSLNIGDLDIRNDRQIAFGVTANPHLPASAGMRPIGRLDLPSVAKLQIISEEHPVPVSFFLISRKPSSFFKFCSVTRSYPIPLPLGDRLGNFVHNLQLCHDMAYDSCNFVA